MNISDQIKSLPSIKMASVVFIPESTTFIVHVDEDMLRKFGCTYTSSKEDRIDELIGILSQARGHEHPNHEASEVRHGIFLKLIDDTEIKLVLGKSQDSYWGEFSTPQGLKKTFFDADDPFITKLYRWAADSDLSYKQGYSDSRCDEYLKTRK